MKNFLDKFCKLRRWIRVYICFLIPAVIALIPVFFLEFIVTYVVIGITALILLPLFIYSEERHHEQEIEERQNFIDQNVSYYLNSLNKKINKTGADAKSTEKETAVNPGTSTNPKSTNLPFFLNVNGLQFKNEQEQMNAYKLGDLISIEHNPSIDYPNAIQIINLRTKVSLKLIDFQFALDLIERYGRKCSFDGEIHKIEYDTDNTINCVIKITKQKN